jgi:hypothetical protein
VNDKDSKLLWEAYLNESSDLQTAMIKVSVSEASPEEVTLVARAIAKDKNLALELGQMLKDQRLVHGLYKKVYKSGREKAYDQLPDEITIALAAHGIDAWTPERPMTNDPTIGYDKPDPSRS